jgi:hypothetical protein
MKLTFGSLKKGGEKGEKSCRKKKVVFFRQNAERGMQNEKCGWLGAFVLRGGENFRRGKNSPPSEGARGGFFSLRPK